jgi:hypothetical protein
MQALIFAMLVVTVPGQEPDNLAAFFTEEGPELCRLMADALNKTGTEAIFVCEVDNDHS